MANQRPERGALPIFQVDAFASRLFAGNPAAVVPLASWLTAATMQRIAAENNLSETAYIVRNRRRRPGDNRPRFGLRWFTPGIEVALCGHATLASGWVVLTHIEPRAQSVVFDTKSGPLTVTRRRNGRADLLELDFPAHQAKPAPAELTGPVSSALGQTPVEIWQSDRLMVVLKNAKTVLAARPDFAALKALPGKGLIITSAADAAHRPADFVSRFFAPYAGVNEDPVTGSAHCTLVPYWARRLGKARLLARQVSTRGGELHCELRGERVAMAGKVAPYLEGTIRVR